MITFAGPYILHMAESQIAAVVAESVQPVAALKARRPISTTFLLVILALAVRLAMMLLAHGWHFVETTGPYPALFQNETTNISACIANGYGYKSPFVSVLAGDPAVGPSSWIAPVYPYLCAAVFSVFGVFSRQSFFFLVLLQCVLSALTCIPIVRVGELTVGRRAGIVAAAVWAVFPWFSQWANTYLWEINLSALLFLCLFWYALELEHRRGWKAWLGFGELWGLALLVNPALLTLLVVSLALLAYRHSHAGIAWIKPVLLALVTCAVVVSPWMIRNRSVFGEWTFIRTNFGFEFWMANYHGSHGRDWAGRHPTTNPQELAEYAQVGELAYVREKSAIAKQFVRDYPGEFLLLTAKRFLMFWDGSTIKYNYPAAPYWLSWSFLPLSLLFIPSLIYFCVRRIRGWELFLGAILLYPAPYYLTFCQARYRHALEPLMLLLIAYAGLACLGLLRNRNDIAITR